VLTLKLIRRVVVRRSLLALSARVLITGMRLASRALKNPIGFEDPFAIRLALARFRYFASYCATFAFANNYKLRGYESMVVIAR